MKIRMSAKFLLKRVFKAALIFLIVIITFCLYVHLSNSVTTTFFSEKEDSILTNIRNREKMLAEISDYQKHNLELRKRHLPKIIGIGVKKCGTGAIIRFLDHHPLFKSLKQNYGEGFFFCDENQIKRGINYYRNMFPLLNDREITMEKTPVYFDMPPHDLPKQIKLFVPDVKLLLVVCDPTTRAFSDYVHERVRFKLFNDQLIAKYTTFGSYINEYLPKMKKLLNEANTSSEDKSVTQIKLSDLFKTDMAATLLSSGLYTYHIQRWRKVFNESSLMVIDGEKLKDDPGPVVKKIQDFVGLPKLLWKEDFVKHPDTGFYCYRHFNETYFNSSSSLSKEEIIKSIACLRGKGRTRNGAQIAEDEDLNKLKEFYSSYNKEFFLEEQRTFKWL